MACKILFDGKNPTAVKSALINYAVNPRKLGEEERFNTFKSRFLEGDIDEKQRFVVKSSDEMDDVHKSIITFYKTLEDVAAEYLLSFPGKTVEVRKLLELVKSSFHIDADQTQSASNESGHETNEEIIETKDIQEIYDRTQLNLDDHLSELYGLGSYGIIKDLEQTFYDRIIGASYYNSMTSESVPINNTTLNSNIERLKQDFVTTIKTFLQSVGIETGSNPTEIKAEFYRYLKNQPDYRKTLAGLYVYKLSDTAKNKKSRMFETLCDTLAKDPNFKEKVLSKLNKYQQSRLGRSLYFGDCFSPSYLAVKQFIETYRKDLLQKIAQIESTSVNLLDATNAYSMLVHFDEMLVNSLGKQIAMLPGTMGLEVPGKYSYHQDTSHEIKGWQTSEDIGSEKHISKFTEAVLSQLRVFDHKTGEYKNRRINSTAFIMAFRHFVDDILYDGIQITGSEKRIRELNNKVRKLVAKFHAHPQRNLQKLLELLFDTTEGENNKPVVTLLSNKKLLTDTDLDVLYSVYIKVFNKNNPTSFISQEISGQKNNVLGAGLMQEIAACADSNVTLDYLETSFDKETGEVMLKVKKKFFNDKMLYSLRQGINEEVNNKAMADREKLAALYEFTQIDSKQTLYTVNIKDSDIAFTVQMSGNLSGQLIASPSPAVKFTDTKVFKDLNAVDLVEFRNYIVNKATPNASQLDLFKRLKSILQFIQDELKMDILSDLGLQTLMIYKASYTPIGGMNNYLMPLVYTAIRAAYVNNQYIEAGDQRLADFLQGDRIFDTYTKNKRSKLFSEAFENVKYVVASTKDTVFEQWADALSTFLGDASKATTKDRQGHSIPNNSVGKLGSIFHHYLYKQQEDPETSSCTSLLFVQDPKAIKRTFHDLEATNHLDESRSIKTFSCSELFFHSIFNKFWGSYVKSGNVVVQPTVYSDKTTFMNWEIQTELMKDPNYKDSVVNTYMSTLGEFYKKSYNKTINKLQQIADDYNLEYNSNLTISQVLKNLTEMQLLDRAAKLGLALEKDKDYRERTKKIKKLDELGNIVEEEIAYCSINEILEYNARVYSDKELLLKALETEKYNFLQNLIDYNASFQVINFSDDIQNYLKDTIDEKASSRNSLINIILQVYTDVQARKNFFENWVDAKTGKLILAKQNGRNILGVGGDFNKREEELELNPLLSKFFYIEGLLSNNLRMSLTGSEVNHPDKAFGTLLNTIKDPEKVHDFVSFNKVTGERLQSKEEYEQLKAIIDQCDTVSEIRDKAVEFANTPIGSILSKIYDKSILKIINTAQGTQFKRNVIIPATLQYCQQGLKNGITPKIKVAVIYDEEAGVHNFRGETKSVEASDGSAQITPFQSILENQSLGSQAVGFIKKPIWHSYDSANGTAFLAKFATYTMTNEAMRTSMHSKTSLFKLFKRMTNLQWEEDIDLTKPIRAEEIDENGNRVDYSDSAGHTRWFQDIILEGKKLHYENISGDVVQIHSLKKSVVKITNPETGEEIAKDLYYTLEQSTGGDVVRVYHLFDNQSNHITFTGPNASNSEAMIKAKELLEQGYHTINSLFELHTSIGGINCVDAKGNSSEFSNQVVVNFMNNIGKRKLGYSRHELIDQETYEQPLKKYHIGYALNNTAVKNGAKNINSSEAWRGDTELRYFEVDSDGLGMQMNADHDIVNSELTEFSQVIAATAAYGFTYDNCNEIFKGLAKTAFQASKPLLDSVEAFLKNLKPEAHSELYDAVGRIILTKDAIKDKESLEGIIKEAVQTVFEKYKNHDEDPEKIPFSDSNIYSGFIASLASTINKDSIKRKHPGSGCVMAPGYNIVTYFEIGNRKYSHQEMLKKARTALKTELMEVLKSSEKYDPETRQYNGTSIMFFSLKDLLAVPEIVEYLSPIVEGQPNLALVTDQVQFNKLLTERYLDKIQEKAPIYYDRSYFQPEDVVRVIKPVVDANGVVRTEIETVVLNSMKAFRHFKDKAIYPEGTVYQLDVKTPRNLKPSLVRWRYDEIADLESLQITKSEYQKPWKADTTKTNTAFALRLNEDPNRFFEVVKDIEDNYWSIHFKTLVDGETYTPAILTEEQKMRLFKAAAAQIPVGDKLSTWGELTPGGVSGLNRFRTLGFKQVGTRMVKDREGNDLEIPIYEKIGKYMTIFDHPVIKDTFDRKGKLGKEHRAAVQKVFNDLHKGVFEKDGITYSIIPGSLEDTEAELVMSNLYKDVFGIGNESLQTILDKGEQYFINQIKTTMHTPVNQLYDVALLKDNGNHTLLRFGPVVQDENCIEIEFNNIQVEEKVHPESGRISYPIYCMRKNRRLFKIGEFVYLSKEEEDELEIVDGTVRNKNNKPINPKQYRIYKNRIQKRVDFVKQYSVATPVVNKTTGQKYLTSNIMYQICSPDVLVDIYKQESDSIEKAEAAAHKQIGSIITNIYLQDNYKFVEFNPQKTDLKKRKREYSSYFSWFFGHTGIKPEHKQYVSKQLDYLGTNTEANEKTLKHLKENFYIAEARKKWISFQDSLKFISSRIPAQTLQSFMTMKCVGWTENTKNMAYVSHFQIYLQGSDYDIDKAYIMGQSYDSSGIYISWSPLFDYTSSETLLLSKQLPTPEGIYIQETETGVDITDDLNTIISNTDDSLQPLSYKSRIEVIKAYTRLLKVINTSAGQVKYFIEKSPKIEKIIYELNRHNAYKIPENLAESAYKNVASANIYAVSQDIRNRDQSYTAITMKTLKNAAKDSPKGEQAETLNMLNPLTKYIMQYQNIVGKNVISIAANGEKIWFNAYYYWTKLLKEGNPRYLQFQTTLSRVANRSKTNSKDLAQLKTVTTKSLPDLNPYDEQIRQILFDSFGVTIGDQDYKYVDQLISQLLSAATDNAKELILAKINSGNNFARMYIYLIMMGYNFDDIVAFMISPVSEFIDSMSMANMFQDSDANNNPYYAILMSRGIVKSKPYLHGKIRIPYVDPETGENTHQFVNKTKYVREFLQRSEFYDEALDALQQVNLVQEEDEDINDLDLLMQGFILASLQNPNIDITDLVNTYDMEINTYLQQCQNIAYKLKEVADKYESLQEMFADAEEFSKIYQLSSEISNIAANWLGLNQGLPTDELGILQRFAKMRNTITSREKAFKIFPSRIFANPDDSDKKKAEAEANFKEVVKALHANNTAIPEEEIAEALQQAYADNLIGTFDVYRYLVDETYRKKMIEYNHYIKGTLNVLDMMEQIPQYKEILNCFKGVVVAKDALASKSRLLTQLLQQYDTSKLTNDQLSRIINYVDSMNTVNFVKSFMKPLVVPTIEGFNSYFAKTKVSKIDLTTFEGMATFKHFMEHEFLSFLKENYSKNPLVKHLVRKLDNTRPVLAPDIDLMNPGATLTTRKGYDEIIRGMAMFESEYFPGIEYSIADLFQLYNLLVHNNKYGSDRFTASFKACTNPNSILKRYFRFMASQDYATNEIQEYNLDDFEIYAAPIVSPSKERFMTSKYIKVKDPVVGYRIKKYHASDNEYSEINLIPDAVAVESRGEKMQRWQNFAEYCPFEMPSFVRNTSLTTTFEFKGEVTPEIIKKIVNSLKELSNVNKLTALKIC